MSETLGVCLADLPPVVSTEIAGSLRRSAFDLVADGQPRPATEAISAEAWGKSCADRTCQKDHSMPAIKNRPSASLVPGSFVKRFQNTPVGFWRPVTFCMPA